MQKLFITDLDGTALGGDYEQYARFPDPFSEFLDRLDNINCHWGINTTWDVDGQWDLIKTSKVKSRPDFLMAEYGCRLATTNDDGPQFVQPYTEKMETRLAQFCKEKFSLLINQIAGRFQPAQIFYYGHLFQFVLAENEDFEQFKQFNEKFFADDDFICGYKGRSISVRPAFLHKGAPLQEVTNRTEFSPDQIITAGDEPADIDMMHPKLSTHYICPVNANEQVKAHVRKYNGEVADLPYGAGVIQAFNRLVKRHNW
ncbi:MAG: HAD hydrolase family protein [Victivallaceae bacterium]|nr:HAD hydrolase family protein [Victivallaceae bacterium]